MMVLPMVNQEVNTALHVLVSKSVQLRGGHHVHLDTVMVLPMVNLFHNIKKSTLLFVFLMSQNSVKVYNLNYKEDTMALRVLF